MWKTCPYTCKLSFWVMEALLGMEFLNYWDEAHYLMQDSDERSLILE